MTTVDAGPVEVFLDALNRGDLATLHALLAPDVALVVPSLRGSVSGRDPATAALSAVLGAFPDLRYTRTSRYLAPGQVTDECMLTGVRLGPWGDLPPSGRPYRLPARVVLDHDGRGVTRLTLWADAGSLRALFDDSVDLSRSAAGPLVDALRATMPLPGRRDYVGSEPDPAAPEPLPATRPDRTDDLNAAALRAAALKVPMPRRRRRTLAVVAALAMVSATTLIVGWVARGALEAPPVAAVSPRPTTGTTTATPSATPSADPSATIGEPAFTQQGNLITLNTDLTFEVDSAELNARAMEALREIMRRVRAEGRRGTIIVNGYTDSDGDRGHNRRLSRARAKAVADVLRTGLANTGIAVRSAGFGEDRPKAPNDTDAHKALNRRVEITVPGDR